MSIMPTYEGDEAAFYWTQTMSFKTDPRISLTHDNNTNITTAVVNVTDVPVEHRHLLINLWKTRGWRLYRSIERHPSIGESYMEFRKYLPGHP